MSGTYIIEIPYKIGEKIMIDRDVLSITRNSLENYDSVVKLPARIVSYIHNSKGTFVKLAVSGKWYCEWFDFDAGTDIDDWMVKGYRESEKLFKIRVPKLVESMQQERMV